MCVVCCLLAVVCWLVVGWWWLAGCRLLVVVRGCWIGGLLGWLLLVAVRRSCLLCKYVLLVVCLHVAWCSLLIFMMCCSFAVCSVYCVVVYVGSDVLRLVCCFSLFGLCSFGVDMLVVCGFHVLFVDCRALVVECCV